MAGHVLHRVPPVYSANKVKELAVTGTPRQQALCMQQHSTHPCSTGKNLTATHPLSPHNPSSRQQLCETGTPKAKL